MKHWHLELLAAATAFFVTSSAQARPTFVSSSGTSPGSARSMISAGAAARSPPTIGSWPRPCRASAPQCAPRASWRVTAAARS